MTWLRVDHRNAHQQNIPFFMCTWNIQLGHSCYRKYERVKWCIIRSLTRRKKLEITDRYLENFKYLIIVQHIHGVGGGGCQPECHLKSWRANIWGGPIPWLKKISGVPWLCLVWGAKLTTYGSFKYSWERREICW